MGGPVRSPIKLDILWEKTILKDRILSGILRTVCVHKFFRSREEIFIHWSPTSLSFPTKKKNIMASPETRKAKGPNIQHLAGTSKRKVKIPPLGYVCNICKASGDDRHYVTACPSKVKPAVVVTSTTTTAAPSTTTVATNKSTISASSNSKDPAANPCKVFVSGLLFSTTKKDLHDMFGNVDESAVVSNVRLLLFTGSKKCNGQAYVTMTTLDGARKAMSTLDGKQVKDAQGTKRMLTVVPALSRNMTNKNNKKRGGGSSGAGSGAGGKFNKTNSNKKQKKGKKGESRDDSSGTWMYKNQGKTFVDE